MHLDLRQYKNALPKPQKKSHFFFLQLNLHKKYSSQSLLMDTDIQKHLHFSFSTKSSDTNSFKPT